MGKTIDQVKALTVTSTAQDVPANCRRFMIENLGETAIYFKEKEADGIDCTTSNGFAVPAATLIDEVFTAQTLSVIGTADTDVRILFLKEY